MTTTIRLIREQLGLSQADMARLMGVDYHTYVKWERGENRITAAPKRFIDLLVWLKSNYPLIFKKIMRLYL